MCFFPAISSALPGASQHVSRQMRYVVPLGVFPAGYDRNTFKGKHPGDILIEDPNQLN